jgi:hypothetical protein
MYDVIFRRSIFATGLALTLLLAACAPMSKTPPAPKNPVAAACQPAQAGDALAGSWLSVYKRKGVAGQFHVLFVFHPDGSMIYTEQIRRGRKPPQELDETGCWHHDKQALVVQTTQSNGVPVESNDPIYTNQYTIVSQRGNMLSLTGPDGAIKARRMPPGYRLPY